MGTLLLKTNKWLQMAWIFTGRKVDQLWYICTILFHAAKKKNEPWLNPSSLMTQKFRGKPWKQGMPESIQ